MCELALQHIGQNLHVVVDVRRETPTARNAVVIEYTEIRDAHARRIVVAGKRETVATLQPSMARPPT